MGQLHNSRVARHFYQTTNKQLSCTPMAKHCRTTEILLGYSLGVCGQLRLNFRCDEISISPDNQPLSACWHLLHTLSFLFSKKSQGTRDNPLTPHKYDWWNVVCFLVQ